MKDKHEINALIKARIPATNREEVRSLITTITGINLTPTYTIGDRFRMTDGHYTGHTYILTRVLYNSVQEYAQLTDEADGYCWASCYPIESLKEISAATMQKICGYTAFERFEQIYR